MTGESTSIDGMEAACQAALKLWTSARCQVLVYTPLVDPRFYACSVNPTLHTLHATELYPRVANGQGVLDNAVPATAARL